MSWDARQPQFGLSSSAVRSNFQALDKLFYNGFGKYNSTTGAEINFAEEGFEPFEDTNYSVIITTVIKKGQAMPTIGKIWVDDITKDGFKVYCDTSVGDNFTWVVGGKR